MTEPVESVVVDLIAKSGNFDTKVKQSASAFGGSMKVIEQAATSAENKVGAALNATAAAQAKLVETYKAGSTVTAKMIKDAGGYATAQKLLTQAMSETAAQAGRTGSAVAQSNTQVQRTAAQAQFASRNLGYQISDIATQLAGGASPFLILAQQGPQVANALDGAGGAVGRFAGFLSTAQGAIVLAAVTLAANFIPKLLQSKESVDSLVKSLIEEEHKTELADKANKIFATTLEGLTKSVRENEAALKDMADANETAADKALKAALVQRAALAAYLSVKLAQQEIAKQDAEIQANRGVGAGQEALAPGANAAGQEIAQKRLDDINKQIATTQGELAKVRKDIIDAASQVIVQSAQGGPEGDINAKYDKRIDDARKLAIAHNTVGDALDRQVRALEAARKVELDRLRDAKKETGETSPFINPVGAGPVTGTFGERRGARAGVGAHAHAGIDIAVPVGTPVKAAAGGTVIEAGTLAGYGNVIIIDHGGGTITRYAHLSRLTATKGQSVDQGQVIGASGGAAGAPGSGNSRGPHLHYEVRVNGQPVDPRKGAFATDAVDAGLKAQQAAQKEEARQQAFENERAGLQADEIRAREALVAAADITAKLETDAIEISRKKYNDNVESEIKNQKLTKAEGDELIALNNERAKLRAELVQRREAERKFRLQEAAAEAALQFSGAQTANQEDLLRSQESIVRTAKERQDIEQRLIDLSFDEERLQLQAIVAKADRLKIETDRIKTLRALSDAEQRDLDQAGRDATIAQQRLGTLPERKANAETSNARANATDLQKFLKEGPQSAAELNSALEDIAAGGLHSIVDGLTDAIVNFRSLGDVGLAVLQQVTQALVRMVVQMLILKALNFFGLAAGGPVSGGSSLGGGLASSAAGLASGGPVPGFPAGGPISGPGGPTDDKVLIRASNEEYMIRASSARKLGRRALDHMNLTGEMPIGFAMGGGIGGGGARLPAGGSSGVTSTLDPASVAQLAQIVSDAAKTQPDIKLFPTADPVAAFKSALAHPGGQRAMFDFFAANPGRFKQAVNQ